MALASLTCHFNSGLLQARQEAPVAAPRNSRETVQGQPRLKW
jgi:hypothetical protein